MQALYPSRQDRTIGCTSSKTSSCCNERSTLKPHRVMPTDRQHLGSGGLTRLQHRWQQDSELPASAARDDTSSPTCVPGANTAGNSKLCGRLSGARTTSSPGSGHSTAAASEPAAGRTRHSTRMLPRSCCSCSWTCGKELGRDQTWDCQQNPLDIFPCQFVQLCLNACA